MPITRKVLDNVYANLRTPEGMDSFIKDIERTEPGFIAWVLHNSSRIVNNLNENLPMRDIKYIVGEVTIAYYLGMACLIESVNKSFYRLTIPKDKELSNSFEAFMTGNLSSKFYNYDISKEPKDSTKRIAKENYLKKQTNDDDDFGNSLRSLKG